MAAMKPHTIIRCQKIRRQLLCSGKHRRSAPEYGVLRLRFSMERAMAGHRCYKSEYRPVHIKDMDSIASGTEMRNQLKDIELALSMRMIRGIAGM